MFVSNMFGKKRASQPKLSFCFYIFSQYDTFSMANAFLGVLVIRRLNVTKPHMEV